jgi:hypothetical protein
VESIEMTGKIDQVSTWTLFFENIAWSWIQGLHSTYRLLSKQAGKETGLLLDGGSGRRTSSDNSGLGLAGLDSILHSLEGVGLGVVDCQWSLCGRSRSGFLGFGCLLAKELEASTLRFRRLGCLSWRSSNTVGGVGDSILGLMGLESIDVSVLDMGQVLLLLGVDLGGDTIGHFLLVTFGHGREAKEGLALLDNGSARAVDLDIIGFAVREVVVDNTGRVLCMVKGFASNCIVSK